MEIQDFILRFSGVQTIVRANNIFKQENQKWKAFFDRISIEYFGDNFVEYKVLKKELDKELSNDCEAWVRRRLLYIFSYEGQSIVSEAEFMRIMRTWSSFSANDINQDNVLDIRELKMLIWLHNNAKPSQAILEREIKIMDRDHNRTIDRIEWVSYLCAPSVSYYQMGNTDYYDFQMRELFDEIDGNKDGTLSIEEICDYLKKDLGNDYSVLDAKRRA